MFSDMSFKCRSTSTFSSYTIAEPDEDEDAPGEDDVEEEKGDNYNDWDVYEQEV